MTLTRRQLLGAGLGTAVLLAAGGIGLSLQPTRMVAPSRPLKALSPRAFSVLVAVADRVCPGTDAAPSATHIGVAELVDDLMGTMHPTDVAEFEQALQLLENGLAGLLLDGRPRTFTTCSKEEQDRVLENWRTSALTLRRKAFKALRGLCAAAFYGNPGAYPAVGYPGPPAQLLALAATPAVPSPPEGQSSEGPPPMEAP
ncbi:MAG: gluconate 2-dehydrogenase subunit 3 family protein [Myxococcota bacterium]